MQSLSYRKRFFTQRTWLPIVLFLGAVMLLLVPEKISAQSNVSKEYQIKAAFLFHFAQFIEWPPMNPTNTAPFRIGVLGDNPFGNSLDEIVKGETIANRAVSVVYSQRPEDLKNCQIVFVSKSEKGHLSHILSELNGEKILTVSECDNFNQFGGVINFYIEDGKVHFEINPDAAERENLKISSQLLRLGKIVKTAAVTKEKT